jgi:hypothetical protein
VANPLLERLRHHVSGAIERGEDEAIVGHPQEIEDLALAAGGRLESFMSNPPRPLAWHFTPDALHRFAEAVRQLGKDEPQPVEGRP